METEINDCVATEIGGTSVRTLSHYLGDVMPRTTVFATADQFSDETTFSFCWNTAQFSELQVLHYAVLDSLKENGFAAFKTVLGLLDSEVDTKQTAGKVKLMKLLPLTVISRITAWA